MAETPRWLRRVLTVAAVLLVGLTVIRLFVPQLDRGWYVSRNERLIKSLPQMAGARVHQFDSHGDWWSTEPISLFGVLPPPAGYYTIARLTNERASLDDVFAFYKQALPGDGWKLIPNGDYVPLPRKGEVRNPPAGVATGQRLSAQRGQSVLSITEWDCPSSPPPCGVTQWRISADYRGAR